MCACVRVAVYVCVFVFRSFFLSSCCYLCGFCVGCENKCIGCTCLCGVFARVWFCVAVCSCVLDRLFAGPSVRLFASLYVYVPVCLRSVAFVFVCLFVRSCVYLVCVRVCMSGCLWMFLVGRARVCLFVCMCVCLFG